MCCAPTCSLISECSQSAFLSALKSVLKDALSGVTLLCHSMVTLSGVISSVTLWCHSLVSLSGVTLWMLENWANWMNWDNWTNWMSWVNWMTLVTLIALILFGDLV